MTETLKKKKASIRNLSIKTSREFPGSFILAFFWRTEKKQGFCDYLGFVSFLFLFILPSLRLKRSFDIYAFACLHVILDYFSQFSPCDHRVEFACFLFVTVGIFIGFVRRELKVSHEAFADLFDFSFFWDESYKLHFIESCHKYFVKNKRKILLTLGTLSS